MTDFWERIESRVLPTSTVSLPLAGGGTVEVVFRALLPAEWEALTASFPSTDPEETSGAVDVPALRPSLLAASVVAPEGSPPKDPAWWEGLAKRGSMTAGELMYLFDQCWSLNQSVPTGPDLGKD